MWKQVIEAKMQFKADEKLVFFLAVVFFGFYFTDLMLRLLLIALLKFLHGIL